MHLIHSDPPYLRKHCHGCQKFLTSIPLGAEGDYGAQGSPFVQLLKQYMARAPAPLGGASLDGGAAAVAPGAGAAGDALAWEARRAGAQLLRAAGAAAGTAEQAALRDVAGAASGRSEGPQGPPDAVRAALAESRQVRCGTHSQHVALYTLNAGAAAPL